MSRVIRVSEGTYQKTDVSIKCSNRFRELSGSRREPLRGLCDDVVELSVPVGVESYQGLSEGTYEKTDVFSK